MNDGKRNFEILRVYIIVRGLIMHPWKQSQSDCFFLCKKGRWKRVYGSNREKLREKYLYYKLRLYNITAFTFVQQPKRAFNSDYMVE